MMRLRETHIGLAALALVVAAGVAAPGLARADHDDDWKKVKHRWRHAKRFDEIRYVPVHGKRAILLRPASEACFVVKRKKALAIRPVPYWSVPYANGVSANLAFHGDAVDVDLAFHDRRMFYGCNFCDAYFPTYAPWKRHVLVCAHRPPVRVIIDPWDDGELVYFSHAARFVCAKYDDDWDDWDDDDWDDDDDD